MVKKKKANMLEFYETPLSYTRALLQRVPIDGVVLEPCVGQGAISKVLEDFELDVITSDIDRKVSAHYYFDATEDAIWKMPPNDGTYYDWVITNPPFSQAPKIIPKAFQSARVGVAMLLRISYLEPCDGRGKWLAKNPPNQVLIMPRNSFTGDGKTDSVTTAWMIWYKDRRVVDKPVQVILREWLCGEENTNSNNRDEHEVSQEAN